MHSRRKQPLPAPHDIYEQVGQLPNGDRLLLNPHDNFVYQVDQARNILLNRFCSLHLWETTFAAIIEQKKSNVFLN